MANYDINELVRVGQTKRLGERIKAEIAKVETKANDAIKSVAVDGNTIKFYTDKAPADDATAAYTVDFPEELFLQQAGTEVVENFTFNAETYAGATNPNLDGKTVLVLAVKGNKAENATVKYSFVNLEKLIDIYTVKAECQKALKITGYVIELIVSPDENNALKITDNGLKVDISDKADRDTDATVHNLAYFDAAGTPVDSQIASSDVVLTSAIATDEKFNEMLNEVFPTVTGGTD